MRIILIISFILIQYASFAGSTTRNWWSPRVHLDTASNPNSFENGISPTTYRFFYPEVNQSGYKMLIFQTEGMDGINYFGSRLEDKNLDGKIDVIQRIKEFMTGNWDFPSANPRPFIRVEIDKDFSSKLVRDTTVLHDGLDQKFFEDASGEYFYNFFSGDPTVISQIGVTDWKGYLSKNGYLENIDYASDGTYVEFMPRIYRKKNGKIEDVTSTHLKFSTRILSTRARYPWDQSLGAGDFDGDGDTDVLTTASHQSSTQQSGLPEFNSSQRNAFYFYQNDGKGVLNGDIYDFSVPGGYNWLIPEATMHYATQMDGDPDLELISELWIDTVGDQNHIPKRNLGFFNLNHSEKKVEFTSLFAGKEYLLDASWNIFPRLFLPMSFLNPQKELILYLFTSPGGSPAKEYTGVNLDASTGSDFTKGVVQQYFRMYEKVKEGNTYKLVDVTNQYFFDGEYQTLSLDNNGTIHLIDVDGDGKLDIYPELGATPYPVGGGLNQFLKYPTWNGKTNTLYYFKQTDNKKFKLTDLAEIKGFYYPNNMPNGFSVFDNSGIYTNGGKEFRIESFTFSNSASLNDIDGDGKLEIISSSNPDYLHIFTKSQLPQNNFERITLSPKLKIKSNQFEIGDIKNRYDFSKINLSSDTLYKILDETITLEFILIDSLKTLTHLSNFLEAFPENSTYYITPPVSINPTKINQNYGIELPLKLPNLYGLQGNASYRSGYYLRKNNDLEVRSTKFYFSNRNIAPLPFEELASKISLNPDLKGFEVEVSISFDLNQNYYLQNNQRVNGLKYGYEIYLGDSLVKRELFSNVNYQLYDNGGKTKIYGLNVLTGNLDVEKIDYKIFALDSFDESIKTYAKMLDRKAPTLSLKSSLTVTLNNLGNYQLSVDQINNGSTDNVGITQMTLSKSTFTCADLGANKITFTARDAAGNSSSAEVTVTVVDEIKPTLKAKAIYTLKLDAEGKASLKWEDLDEGSSDNCSIKDKILSKSTFTCADLGANKITFTAKDASGNTSSAEVTVTVLDELKPTLKTKSNFTLKLDAEGKASLKWEDLDEGSSDNCSIKDKILSKSTFTCADLGANKVTFTAKDASGNTSSAEVTVNVVDEIKPTLKAKSNYTIKLDVQGKAALKWEDLDEGSTDNCSIKERKLSKTDFARADGGDNKVTYTLTDASGNTSSVEITVRVDIVLSAPERSNQGSSVKAFPNPVNDYLYLEFAAGVSPSTIRESSLVDASGRVLREIRLEEGVDGQVGFSTQELKAGMYFLRLSTRDTLHLIKFTVIH